jgi:hypothetical protein
MYALYWDESDENDPTYEKVRRAIYASKAEALTQAEADMAYGRRVLCIEKLDHLEREHMNRGKVVWEPSNDDAS